MGAGERAPSGYSAGPVLADSERQGGAGGLAYIVAHASEQTAAALLPALLLTIIPQFMANMASKNYYKSLWCYSVCTKLGQSRGSSVSFNNDSPPAPSRAAFDAVEHRGRGQFCLSYGYSNSKIIKNEERASGGRECI